MADFAPNVTARYRLNYHGALRNHSIMCRGARGTSFAAMETIGIGFFFGLFDALSALMFDDLAFLSADIALTDSDLFFPCATPAAVTGAQAIAQCTGQDSITHYTFSGRGTLGSKVSMHVYGVQSFPDLLPPDASADFVFLSSEVTAIADAVAILNNPATDIVAIDNTKPLFAARATLKVNDYWLRQLRRGS